MKKILLNKLLLYLSEWVTTTCSTISKQARLSFLYHFHTLFPTSSFLLIFLLAIPLLCTLPTSRAAKVESTKYYYAISRSTDTHNGSTFLGTEEQIFSFNLSDISVDPATITGNKTGIAFPLASPIPSSLLSWESVSDGGYVARLRISANDQVKQLRLHLTFENTMQSVSFRLKGNLDNFLIGPISNINTYDGVIWLPITNGNSADLEIFVETLIPEMPNFKIDLINLIMVNSVKESYSSVVSQSLGYAKNEQYDLACWTENIDYPALEAAASSTALISFIKDGASFICTGTLLADVGSTLTPWFITANHCISDQDTASTAIFEWFLQSTVCGGALTDLRYEKTFGGAELLWNDSGMDVSFFRLREKPSLNVVFSAWSTDIQIGDPVWSVHHPEGDHTMVNNGKVTELFKNVLDEDGNYHVFDTVKYEQGSSEGGSSGSGIFTVEKGQAYWKGTLFGSSLVDYQTSYYSHFSSYYENLKQWLSDPAINCLLNWAENSYPNLFSPQGKTTLELSPYTYRYYETTNAYVGVSSFDDHVYYLGPDGMLLDVGNLSDWLKKSSCQGII